GLLSACESSEQSRIQRRSVVSNSTTIIAFDQHAATTVAAVLVPVRTLRKAAQDGRLQATFSTRMAFGKRVAFASRAAVERFRRQYYRQTTQWNRPPRPAVYIVPPDYDRVVHALRTKLQLTQAALAVRIGAANKAVIYQWESRRRRP